MGHYFFLDVVDLWFAGGHDVQLVIECLLGTGAILEVKIGFPDELFHISVKVARQVFADTYEFALPVLKIDRIRNIVHERVKEVFFFLLRINVLSNNKLTSVMEKLEASNRTFIFNSHESVDIKNEEEVMARLTTNLKKVREFIQAISGGNYGITWEGMNDGNKDANRGSIAGELLHMRDQMALVKEQDQIRIWTTEGLSKFGEIIRKYQNNFEKLSETLIPNKYLFFDKGAGDFSNKIISSSD